jgi:hypothetical protein
MKIPRMNCVPQCVLDAEVGFTRKLAPAPKQVIADINRKTKQLQLAEGLRRKPGRKAA